MILPIRKIGDPILEKPCEKVDLNDRDQQISFFTRNGNDIYQFIKNMIETARAHYAVGLAANQVGESLRIFVFKKKPLMKLHNGQDDFGVAINPTILPYPCPKALQEEGCLSIPKIFGLVSRYEMIKVEYFNEKGEKIEKLLSGLAARIYQHEFDHLNGINMLERATKIYYRK